MLTILELIARLQFTHRHSFWSAVDSSDKPIDVLFLGSSRVGAAIDTQAFEAAIPGRRPHVVNTGAGYTTVAEFHLALRNTFREHPDRLRNAVIFIEAPGGMPDSAAWSDPWQHPTRPDRLTPLLRREDFASYWSAIQAETVTARFEKQLHLIFDYAFRFSCLVTDRLTLGERFAEFAESPVKRLLESFLPSNHTEARVDLSSAGGIRTDVEGVALARRRAFEYIEQALQNQHRVDWNAAIVADTVKLAQQNGARIVFFDLPIHSAYRSILETPTRQADRAAFREIIQTWNTPLITPDFSATDDDFPDIWHLKKSLAADFTRALATAWRQL